jgi:voltage-gated sodium channel
MLNIYLWAIIGVLVFSEQDPARFGGVLLAMLTLFQVSTLSGWSDIAYTSWYGCLEYSSSHYLDSEVEIKQHIPTGSLLMYKCPEKEPKPLQAIFFFSIFIVVTSWVIISLFIGKYLPVSLKPSLSVNCMSKVLFPMECSTHS